MVLDDAPTSDGDPYDSQNSTGSTPLVIDASKLPKTITGKSITERPAWAQWQAREIQEASKLLNRPLKPEEIQAMAYWKARFMSRASWGAPIGFLVGAWRWKAHMSTNRYVFWTPNPENLKPDAWPSFRPVVTGPLAGYARHAARFSVYTSIGTVVGVTLVTNYVAVTTMLGQNADPALKEITEAKAKLIRQRITESRSRQPPYPVPGSTSERPPGEETSTSPYGDEQQYDSDMSSLQKDISDAERRPTSDQRPQPVFPGSGRSQQQRPVVKKEEPDEFLDDASPTGGRGMSDDAPVSTSDSAWDRLRQQGTPSGGYRSPTEAVRKTSSNSGSSWQKIRSSAQEGSPSYSTADEERQLAKSEAQKEFDARVERERRGGDFSSGSGSGGRW